MLFKLNLLLCLCVSVFSYAESGFESHTANGQELLLKDVVFISGKLSQANLAVKTDIRFGENTLKGVPEGTNLYFIKNDNEERYVSLITFSKTLEVQNWKVSSGEIKLNCSPYSENGLLRGRVVSFYKNHQLNGRCRSVGDQEISAPNNSKVTLASGAEVYLTKDGLLKSASKISEGYVHVNEQRVSLREGSSLDFHNEGGIHFFYMADGESFTAPTSLSPETKFEQLADERALPFLLYTNGSVESGRFVMDSELSLDVVVFNQTLELNLLEGPVGFDEQGRLDRIILKESLDVILNEDAKLYFRDMENKETLVSTMKQGEVFPLSRGDHLFFGYGADGKVVLNGFPVVIQGVRYFLSLTGQI